MNQLVAVSGGTTFDLDGYLEATSSVQVLLQAARNQNEHAWCLCTQPARPLQLRRIRGRVFLAVWPLDGYRHDVSCAFHRDPAEEEIAGPASSGDAVVAMPEAPAWTRDAAAVSAIPGQAPAPQAPVAHRPAGQPAQDDEGDHLPAQFSWSHHGAGSPGPEGLSLHEVFQALWTRSRLNTWWPHWKRNWWRLCREIEKTALQTSVNGELLADRLFVPGGASRTADVTDKDRLDAFKRHLIAAGGPASGGAQRGLLLGEVQSLTSARRGFVLRMRGIHAPIFVSGSARTALLRRFSRIVNLLEGRGQVGGRVLGLMLVEPSVKGDGWSLHGAFLTLATDLWLPCSSPADLDLAQLLVAEGRGFVREFGPAPERSMSASAGSDLFVLRDCLPHCAVWATPDSGVLHMRRAREIEAAAAARGYRFHVWHPGPSASSLPPKN